MPNTYSWMFPRLDVYPTYETVTNAVFQVHWRLLADDGSGHIARAYGAQMCGAINPLVFIPYDDLTPADVQGWVEAQMGDDLDAIKAELDAKILSTLSPATLGLPPPWI